MCCLIGPPISCNVLPICIIMLKPFVVDRECKYSGVVVKPKIVIGTLDSLYFLRSELWQPVKIIYQLNHEYS